MKYKEIKVVEANEIEKAVEKHYGVNIELAELMWPENFMNDCYKYLCFDEDMIMENKEDMERHPEKARYRERAMVYSIMKNYFPDDETVLVDVSW